MQTSNLADLPDNHQHRTIATALSFVGDFTLALDCGAHRGTVTAQLLRRFSFVVAIEPSELAQRIPKGARVIQAALGDKPGHCSMKHGTENTGQRHVVEGADTPVITIDSLGLSPTFIKLDVEGMEWHAIKGAEQTIKQFKPVIMLEENGLNRRYGVPDGETGRLLESWGAVRVAVCNKDWIYKW
ncbi:FkbM family methyltransferase [Limnobacter sp.]|uniref:FkbM family methyltransferase n=1 Tax=Limnobacter sp. TaxID=2003368 RepID=UPI0027371CAF|nr:FkbM family methyltransferase [Limnobacter sp.]MDP3273440.1 FkbM family methyltransferase [Limnobacter sp.]